MFNMRQIEDRMRRGWSVNGLTLPEEQLLIAHARKRGMKAEELIASWRRDRQTQSAVAGGNVPLMGHFAARPERLNLASTDLDLDHWADDPDAPGDDDDDELDPVCGACDGSGKDAAGNVCKACNGTGKAPVNDDDDGDETDEIEGRKYAIQFEDE